MRVCGIDVSSLLQAALPGTICVRVRACVWNRRVVALAGRAAGNNMCACACVWKGLLTRSLVE